MPKNLILTAVIVVSVIAIVTTISVVMTKKSPAASGAKVLNDGSVAATTSAPIAADTAPPTPADSASPSIFLSSVPTGSPTKPILWKKIGNDIYGGNTISQLTPYVEMSLGGNLLWSSGDATLMCHAFDEEGGWMLRQDLSKIFKGPVFSVAATPDGRTVVAGAGVEEQALVFFNEDPSDANSIWTIRGSAIKSGVEAKNPEYFGYAVDVTDDGDTVVVSSFVGQYVHLLKYRGTDWMLFYKLGDSETKGGEKMEYGVSLALSGDGSHLLVGAQRYAENFKGAAFAYEIADAMITFKQRIIGNSALDGFGRTVSLSRDGSVAAVGTNKNLENYGGIDSADYVKVFKLNDRSDDGNTDYYLPIGETDIERDATKMFGMSVALSADGRRLVIGSVSAPPSMGLSMTMDVGKAFVYAINDDGWEELDQFSTENPGEDSVRVAISEDGRSIVMASSAYSGSGPVSFMSVHQSSPGE